MALVVIAIAALGIFTDRTTSTDNIIDSKKWEAVSEGNGVLLGETPAKLIKYVSIQHYPPRLVGWDANVIITITTNASETTNAYLYIREKDKESGLRYPVSFEIPAAEQALKFKINMGTENLSNIVNAELYILDSDDRKLSDKFDQFGVLRGVDFTPTIAVFTTMIAIVLALSSLWARPTLRPVRKGPQIPEETPATLGRFWNYMAVFIALLGLICFLSQFSPHIEVTPHILPLYFVVLALLISSIAMVILSVFESILSVIVTIFVKGVYNRCIDFESYYKCAFAFLIFFALAMFVSLIWLIANEFSWWLNWLKIVPAVAFAVIGLHIWIIKRYGE